MVTQLEKRALPKLTKIRWRVLSFVPHLHAGVNVISHVVVLQPLVHPVKRSREHNFPVLYGKMKTFFDLKMLFSVNKTPYNLYWKEEPNLRAE